MQDSSVTAEIHRLIDERLSSNVAVTVKWVSKCILDLHGDIRGGDAGFYKQHASRDIERIAKSALGKYEATDTTPEELVLPGFKHLARAYPVMRKGVNMIVPIDQCTEGELLERASLLAKQAKGCVAHESELREYILAKFSSAAAA